ncbi:bifunctional phosphoribosylaminoimidazolecarboxamide formyltransferase/IMP cyclohydrolase, partial [Candidatus Daviesbacteria bacterium]|nr:bifunctional phosphoribosylaminoimidazolecarboxamide formyltransferase/IMP cyclohydrolase [Candidatus Daviesbacteria bacterium]
MDASYALISVYDKTGIVEFAKKLVDLGYKIISTGGTAEALQKSGIEIIPIQEITKNPESFDGRIKTISFQIESGILFNRDNQKHLREAEELGILPIDIVVCNLYPFRETVQNKKSTEDEIIESIDVGGPTMLRAAAKNFKFVLPVCYLEDYQFVGELLAKGEITKETREEFAQKTFEYLSFYDSQVATYFRKQTENIFPEFLSVPLEKIIKLRYGDNPHQQAALYLRPSV